jgi:hypothetical protein
MDARKQVVWHVAEDTFLLSLAAPVGHWKEESRVPIHQLIIALLSEEEESAVIAKR